VAATRFPWRIGGRLEMVKHRPLQFCLFLSTLFGQKAMEVLMFSAIKNSRAVAGQSGGPEAGAT
jgi:hypothetical protein